MVAHAIDNLEGEISRFIEMTADAISFYLSVETEKWLHRSLCHHEPTLIGNTLPLTEAAKQYVMQHAQIRLFQMLDEGEAWFASVLFVDGVGIAELRHRAQVEHGTVTIKYNCKGLIP